MGVCVRDGSHGPVTGDAVQDGPARDCRERRRRSGDISAAEQALHPRGHEVSRRGQPDTVSVFVVLCLSLSHAMTCEHSVTGPDPPCSDWPPYAAVKIDDAGGMID